MTVITLTGLEQKLEELESEHEELLEQAARIEQKIAAYRVVIDDCSDHAEERELNLSGLSLEEALVAFAEHHGDGLSTYRVRPALVEAGVLKGEARAVSVKLYSVLSSSDRFEPAGPRGHYRLVFPPSDSDISLDEELGLT